MRIAVIGLLILIGLAGAVVYLGQAVQPERETTVEIIPNDKLK